MPSAMGGTAQPVGSRPLLERKELGAWGLTGWLEVAARELEGGVCIWARDGGELHSAMPISDLASGLPLWVANLSVEEGAALPLHVVFLIGIGGCWQKRVCRVSMAGAPIFWILCRRSYILDG